MTPAGSPAHRRPNDATPDRGTQPSHHLGDQDGGGHRPAEQDDQAEQFSAFLVEAGQRRAQHTDRDLGRPQDWADPDPAAALALPTRRHPVTRAAARCREGRSQEYFLADARRACGRLQGLDHRTLTADDVLAYPWHHIDVDTAQEYRQLIYRMFTVQSTRNDAVSIGRRIIIQCHQVGLISPLRRDEVLEELFTTAPGVSTRRRRLTPAEGDALLAACASVGTPAARARNSAVVALFRTTGIRIGELVAIRLCDWDPIAHTVYLAMTKNGKPHLLPVHPDVVPYLEHWLTLRGDAPGALFTPLDGEDTRSLNPASVQYMLQTRAVRAGVTPFSAHDFRRTFATDLLRTHDPSLVGKLMNHARLSSTLVYDMAGDDEMRAAVGTLTLPRLADLQPRDCPTRPIGQDHAA